MKTALDTNILSTIWMGQPSTEAVKAALKAAKTDGSVVLSPPVYAESLANPYLTQDIIRDFLIDAEITIDMPLLDAVWTEAGLRYQHYAARRRQKTVDMPRRILADFLIGAHALLQADRLMTFDTLYYRTYFPELRLYVLEEQLPKS